MAQFIDKATVVAEIKKLQKRYSETQTRNNYEEGLKEGRLIGYKDALHKLDTLEIKEVKDNSLEKFKSLQHINKDLNRTLEDWGYTPNLYYFDGSWHVDWISCEEGDSIKDFTGDTAEKAINEAYNWFHSTFCND